MGRSDDNRVVFASGNAGKLREVAALLQGLGMSVVAQGDLGIDSIEETGSTFVANALLKARHAAQSSGLPAIADDSGLCVDALGGQPGVRSARYAGETASDADNIEMLLDELYGAPDKRRGAAFHCAAVFVEPGADAEPLIAEGSWPGRILRQPDGDGGFGYDPVFFDPEAGKSAANMTREEKNGLSHRGKAFRQLEQLLRERRGLV